jgi:hypothetical protein
VPGEPADDKKEEAPAAEAAPEEPKEEVAEDKQEDVPAGPNAASPSFL